MLLTPDDIAETALDLMNREHEEALHHINAVWADIEAGDRDAALAAYRDYVHQTENHFRTEEEAMIAANYFQLNMHKAEHDLYRGMLHHNLERMEEGADLDVLKAFMAGDGSEWLKLHIKAQDQATALVMTGKSGTKDPMRRNAPFPRL